MTNTLGAVVVFDGETPKTYTALAMTVISGGQFVVYSGTGNSVGSQVSSFQPSDIVVDILHDTDTCNGIALNNAGSNTYVTIARQGTFLVRCASVISGGGAVVPFSGTTQAVINQGYTGSGTGTTIGRALITGASGTAAYTLVSLNV